MVSYGVVAVVGERLGTVFHTRAVVKICICVFIMYHKSTNNIMMQNRSLVQLGRSTITTICVKNIL